MILDGDMILSDAQAVTTAEATNSTNVIDFGAAGVGHNQKVIINVNTTVAAAAGAANVTFAVLSDSAETFDVAAITHITTAAIAKATLIAGYRVLEFTLPANVKQFVKVVYTPDTNPLTAGKFNAFIDNAVQTNGV